MGIYFDMITVSDEHIEQSLSFGPLAWRFYSPEDIDLYRSAVMETRRLNLWQILVGKKIDKSPIIIPNVEYTPGERKDCSLGKTWHGLHYLLTGTSYGGKPPLNFIISGGRHIKNSSPGDGSNGLRAFTSKDVKDIWQALLKVEISVLRSRYNPRKMNKLKIYPKFWSLEGNEDLDDIVESFKLIIDFLEDAVAEKMGMIAHIG